MQVICAIDVSGSNWPGIICRPIMCQFHLNDEESYGGSDGGRYTEIIGIVLLRT